MERRKPNMLTARSLRSRIVGGVVVLLCIISAHHFGYKEFQPELLNAAGGIHMAAAATLE
jgi:hypothetical protein